MTKTLHALFSVTFPPRLLLACVSSGSSSTIGHLIENSGTQISLCQEEGNDLLPSILVKVCLVYLLCSLKSKDGPEVISNDAYTATLFLVLCGCPFAIFRAQWSQCCTTEGLTCPYDSLSSRWNGQESSSYARKGLPSNEVLCSPSRLKKRISP